MRNIKITALLSLFIGLLSPAVANASTTVTGGPLTNLKPTDQVIHLSLSNFPSTAGLYIMQCVKSSDANRPTICNQAAQLWISNNQGASFTPNADIQFKPTAIFSAGGNAVDCTKSTCGIFIRFDHTASADTSEDQFIPLTFTASGTPGLQADVINRLWFCCHLRLPTLSRYQRRVINLLTPTFIAQKVG